MALTLKQLQKRSQTKLDDSNKQSEHEKKSLRPWHTFNDQSTQTRTVGAVEAVKKAREIVAKNDEWARSHQSGFKAEELELKAPVVQSEAAALNDLETKAQKLYHYHRPPGFFSFLRYLFK